MQRHLAGSKVKASLVDHSQENLAAADELHDLVLGQAMR